MAARPKRLIKPPPRSSQASAPLRPAVAASLSTAHRQSQGRGACQRRHRDHRPAGRILEEERDLAISSRPLETTAFDVENSERCSISTKRLAPALPARSGGRRAADQQPRSHLPTGGSAEIGTGGGTPAARAPIRAQQEVGVATEMLLTKAEQVSDDGRAPPNYAYTAHSPPGSRLLGGG